MVAVVINLWKADVLTRVPLCRRVFVSARSSSCGSWKRKHRSTEVTENLRSNPGAKMTGWRYSDVFAELLRLSILDRASGDSVDAAGCRNKSPPRRGSANAVTRFDGGSQPPCVAHSSWHTRFKTSEIRSEHGSVLATSGDWWPRAGRACYKRVSGFRPAIEGVLTRLRLPLGIPPKVRRGRRKFFVAVL